MDNKFKNQTRNKIRVLILSDYQIIRESLKTLIEDSPDMIVTNAVNKAENITEAKKLETVDTVLIYLTDDDAETVEMIPRFTELASHLRVIVVTSAQDSGNQMRALELGAVGIVNKEQNARILLEAIRQTYKGDTWIKQQLLTKLLGNKKQKNDGSKSWNLAEANALTTREKEVVQMIGKGFKNKEIAEKLFISEATVRHHLSSIYGKLGVEDRLNLVIYAYQHNLIQTENRDENNTVFLQ